MELAHGHDVGVRLNHDLDCGDLRHNRGIAAFILLLLFLFKVNFTRQIARGSFKLDRHFIRHN